MTALFLSGCAADEVEFQGKIFELAGLSDLGKSGKKPELAPRTGLVVPPDLNRLPDPDQAAAPVQGEDALASINDPDRAKVQSKEQLERQQAEACKEYDLAKQRGQEDAVNIEGPLGPCRPSVLTSLGKWMGSN